MVAKSKHMSISGLIADLVADGLSIQKQDQVARLYDSLDKVKGICKDNLLDASQTVDTSSNRLAENSVRMDEKNLPNSIERNEQ